MDHEDIIDRAAESIMQRANDTYPRTLHKDMLVDEIGKAIKEATNRSDWANWPPAISYVEQLAMEQVEYLQRINSAADPITSRHERFRKKLEKHLADYCWRPE